jgi:hypothetical protein|nr:MAG TPA: hypothetical protein [Herelleviridae sp.]
MWIIKNEELINLTNIDSIDFNICESDDQFELDFYRGGNNIGYLFFDSEKELKNAFLNIKTALKNDKKFLEL